MISSINGIFKNRNSLLAFVLAFIPICSIVGFLPYSNIVYYAYLLLLLFYGVLMGNIRLNIWMLLLVYASVISILWGNPPSVFQAWEHLWLFILVVSVISPLIQNKTFINLRLMAFRWLIFFSIGIAVGSFLCYFLGINYMNPEKYSIVSNAVGWFGGLTVNSMILGPISAIATTCLMWLYLTRRDSLRSSQKMFILICLFCSFCSVLMTASRGSFLAMSVGMVSIIYSLLRGAYFKLFNVVIPIIIAIFLLYPIYRPFADNLIKKQQSNVEIGGTFASRESKWNNRIEEFKGSPLFGVGFASLDPKNNADYTNYSIEPGSSWLAIFSMTGLLGGGVIMVLLLYCYRFLYKNIENYKCALYLALLNVFVIHMCTEGYIFSGGSFLFFYFWLLVGSILALRYQNIIDY